MRKFILLIIFLFITQSTMAWVSVGESPGFGTCHYTSLPDALLSGEQEIRLLNNQEFIQNITINKSTTLRGGFGSCLLAQLNLPNETNTVIKGTQSVGESVIKINPSIQTLPQVSIHNITLRDANNGGSGIEIGNTSVSLSLYDSLIIGNSATDGAGLYVGNPIEVYVLIKDSSIFGNSATNRGGGVFCANANTTINIVGESLIGENSAFDGGGIYATNGCSVLIDSGIDINSSNDLRGVMGNSASNNGGGLYVDLAAEIRLLGNTYNSNPLIFPFVEAGNSINPFTLASNSALNDGGGIYANRNADITIIDGLIENNTAATLGGGIYITNDSEVNIQKSSNNSCWNNENKCSIIANNKAGLQGGGLYLTNESIVQVEKTHIFGNRADFGTFVYARSSSTVGTFLNNMIYKNGDNGATNYDDKYVFRGFAGAHFSIHHNTIANNNIADDRAIIGLSGTGTGLNITNSIINNGETILENVSNSTYSATCVLVDETSTLTGSGVANLAVDFIDSNNENFHINSGSDAIDYCAENKSIEELERDIDNGIRPIDDDNVINNAFGLADAGADEFGSANNDVIFKNGFE